MPDANEIEFGKKSVIVFEIVEASAVNITADGFHAVLCTVVSPEYVTLAVVKLPPAILPVAANCPAVTKLPPVMLPVAVIVLDAAMVVTPDTAPDEIVAVPSVNEPPVIAPDPVIVVAPAIAPDEIVAVPSVNEPPVIAPEAVIATAPVTVPSDDTNAPSVIVPAVTRFPPVTLPVTVIAGVVILDVLIVVAKDASDVFEKICMLPDAFTLT